MKNIFKWLILKFQIDRIVSYLCLLNMERKSYPIRSYIMNRGSQYNGPCRITNLSKFQIGNGSNIKNAYIESSGGVSIGNYVHCGIGLTIFSTNHNYKTDAGIPYDNIEIVRPVVIEDFVWIGANVSIVPGVTIGEGAVVGMGAVVTKNVEPGSIVGGNPAIKIGMRDMELFERLKNEKRFF